MLQGLLEGFSLGIWTLIGAAVGPLVVCVGLGFRKVVAYFNGVPTPERPLMAWCVLTAVVFAVAGSMWQAKAGPFAECREAGGTNAQCLILPQSSKP